MDVAEVAGSPATAASNAVLAGIAAADAACCLALGERSQGQDHRDAVGLLARVQPAGAEAAAALQRLLALKHAAEYGLSPISKTKRDGAIRQARKLIDVAEATVAR